MRQFQKLYMIYISRTVNARSLTAAFELQIHAPPVSAVSSVSAVNGDRTAALCHIKCVAIVLLIILSTNPVVSVDHCGTRVAGLNRERLSNDGAFADGKSRTFFLHIASLDETGTW